MIEFTGERVVPGQVDPDLWNEHFSRYVFASRLARRRRVLDAGCGTGYGTAELARAAVRVVGADLSAEAVEYAHRQYAAPNLEFVQADCARLPFRDASFDLAVSFELIEHLDDWRSFLHELRRVLTSAGQCVISTPNRNTYAETRALTGPNPFHRHEFDFEEFREELQAVFPQVALYLQNHVDGFVFAPVQSVSGVEARLADTNPRPGEAHFFVAVCALSKQTGAPAFLYIPEAGNVLRERAKHIASLEAQLAERTCERDRLIEISQAQKAEMEAQASGYEEQIRQLQQEMAGQASGYENQIAELQAEIAKQAGVYEERLGELEADCRQKAEWAQRTSAELEAKVRELAHAVEVLHETERLLAERTRWAQDLDARLQHLEGLLNTVRSSRWIKLGTKLGVGPRLQNE
ncbi:MAG: methyltransferase domain-containing protein [Bryobacteraceae bacterium]|nr:methyltransferase domain-containing protein [Bryobacteraceae bacterium]